MPTSFSKTKVQNIIKRERAGDRGGRGTFSHRRSFYRGNTMKECYTSTAHTVEIVSSSHRFPSFFFFCLLSTNFSRSNAPERGILKKAVEKKTGRSFSTGFPILPLYPPFPYFTGKER